MKKNLLLFFLFAVFVNYNALAARRSGPPSQASDIYFVSDKNSTTIGWSAGDGSIGRAVFVAAVSTGAPSPVDNTQYTPNTVFGAGDQIGTSGWYCVSYDSYSNYFSKNGNATVTVTGLTVGVTYRVAVIECYIGGGFSTVTAAGNPANITPSELPTVPASNITFSNTSATATTVSFTNGDGTSRSVYISAGTTGNPAPVNGTSYKGSTTFGSGSQIGTSGWYCVSTYAGSPLTVTGLNPGSTYRVAVVEQKVYTNSPEYLTAGGTNNPANITMPAAPTVQASNIVFTATTPSSTSLSWTNGNGTSRAVFVAQAGTGMPAPVNGSSYPAGSFGAAASQIGTSGWYCVYDGTASSGGFSGLTAGQTYRVAVIEHARSTSGEQYATIAGANNPVNVIAAYAAPSVASSNLSVINTTGYATAYNFTAGNGEDRAVFIAAAGSGSPAPVDATTYTANTAFGQGTQIGTSGWYCIHNGPYAAGTYITGLSPGTTYRIAVVDYNLSSGHELYAPATSTGSVVNFTTTAISAPAVAASNITFTNTTSSSTTVSWTNGNGTARAVFVAAASGGMPVLANGTAYSANTTIGAASQTGTPAWYCVYNGTGNTTPVYGLTTGVTYQVMVVEYNNDSSNEDQTYTAASGTGNPASLTVQAVQSSNVVFSATTGTATTVSWTSGNGAGRAVFINNTDSGSPAPASGTAYTANTAFGSGAQIGTTGWYCIYNGTGTTTGVTGLTAGKTYRVAVMDYTGSASAPVFLTAAAAGNPANAAAVTTAPSVQAVIGTVTTAPYTAAINFTPGNGTSQAVFVTTAATGYPAPADNTAYVAGNYGSGSQIGTTGWYCVYNGAAKNSATISGLKPATNYLVAVVAYNNTAGVNDQAYAAVNGSGNNPVSITTGTLNLPTVQASNVLVTNTTNTTATINYTNGNGQAQAIFMSPATVQGFPQPAYGVLYNVYNSQGQIEIGTTNEGLYGQPYSALGTSGWYCVGHILNAYTPNPLNIFGLSPGTTYNVAVVTYNNVFGYAPTGQETYLQTPGVNNPVTFTTAKTAIAAPTVAASAITFTNTTTVSSNINWVNGNGNKRLVFVSAGTANDLALVSGTNYTANSAYGAGSPTGASNWYCIYNGTSATAYVSGLLSNTAYRAAVVELNEDGDSRMYAPPVYNTMTTTFTLPVNNFTVSATSLSCKGQQNGVISITAAQALNYTATLSGAGINTVTPFTTTAGFNGLAAGIYSVCLTVAAQPSYQQCFNVTLTEPKDLSVYAAVNKDVNTVSLNLSGGASYIVEINGTRYNTTGSSLTVPVNNGSNTLTVSTDKECQGIVRQIINLSGNLQPYPNPVQDVLNVNIGLAKAGQATLKIYNIGTGKLEQASTYHNQSGVQQLDVSGLKSGLYNLKLTIDGKDSDFKILKK